MANIKLIDLAANSANETDLLGNLDSFIRDLSEQQVSLQGGMCVASDGESSGGCADFMTRRRYLSNKYLRLAT
jgi:hypothetical protein